MAETEFKHLVRIANADLDGNKKLYHSLTKIKGVSFSLANAIVSVASIDKLKKTGNLSEEEMKKLDQIIKDPAKFNIPSWLYNRRKDYDTGKDIHLTAVDLDLTKDFDLKRLKKIKSYRGIRHMSGLPVRGQRTKANFRRNKGKVASVKRRKGAKSGRP